MSAVQAVNSADAGITMAWFEFSHGPPFGLWNQRHVDDNYEPRFLDVLETAIVRSTDS